MSGQEDGHLIVTSPNAEPMTIRTPELVAITYTAIYDDGSTVIGTVVHDGGEEPMTARFGHCRGQSSGLR